MKFSARNILSGRIVNLQRGLTTANVKVDLGQGVIVTSVITVEAVEDLGLQIGDTVSAVIKASDVMIAK